MTRDEATVDRIFAGNLDGLPPLSSKVRSCQSRSHCQLFISSTSLPGKILNIIKFVTTSQFLQTFRLTLLLSIICRIKKCLFIHVRKILGGSYLHQLHLHRYADGEEHLDGVCLPQDQGVLQGEARAGVPGGGHEVGGEGRDDRRAHDHCSLHERAEGLPEVLHGTQFHIFWGSKVRNKLHTQYYPLKRVSTSFTSLS